MTRRQRKKQLRKRLAARWGRWYGEPLPRRLTWDIRRQSTLHTMMDAMPRLVDTIPMQTPFFHRLIACDPDERAI